MKTKLYSVIAGPMALSLVILGSLGCSGDDSSADVIKVGWIGPLTGPVAAVGIDNARGVELAVADLNAQGGIDGQRIELLLEDSTSSVDKAVQLYERMRDRPLPPVYRPSHGLRRIAGARLQGRCGRHGRGQYHGHQ